MQQIAEDEKIVIQHLVRDARQSIDQLAKSCGFSRQKVWRIMKRLEENQTIWGYTAVVDTEKLGEKSYVLLLKARSFPLTKKVAGKIVDRAIDEQAAKLGITIKGSFWVNGCYDGMVCFTAHNIKQAKQFCDLFIRIYERDVDELELLERIFPVKQCMLINPRLKDIEAYL
jgi:DNA-binding Lrp family transcriptional regulator